VLLVRNKERDGYDAIQVGFDEKSRQNATRAERGHVSEDMESKRRQAGGKPLAPKANVEPPRHVREFRVTEPATIEVGKILTVTDVFQNIKAVDVTGTSKGRGFTGVMKRHNFQGLPAAHGAKKVHRSAGSMGSHASNRGFGRPKKGHKGAGQYGNAQRTVRNLTVVRVDGENDLILVRGAVPGPNGGFIVVRPTNKRG
jgi:large subunit ribosomal protein L3